MNLGCSCYTGFPRYMVNSWRTKHPEQSIIFSGRTRMKLNYFQNPLNLPVAAPENRLVKQCTRATDQRTHFERDGVIINGTCFHVSYICHNGEDTAEELLNLRARTYINDFIKFVSLQKKILELAFSIGF